MEYCGDYVRSSNEDPAKFGLESKRIISVELFFLSVPSNFLLRHFHDLDSNDLGLWDLGMNNDRTDI